MKRLCKKDSKEKPQLTRKGVASLYIVIFATILFGVVTLSFMRIILSEAGQSSDDDLSRSAYDSAMAGVEDAKTAVNRYYQCLSGNAVAGFKCDEDARDALFKKDCKNASGTEIGMATYLYGSGYSSTGGEVKIQQSNVGAGVDNASDQAYTCVIVSDVVPDYRGTLSSDTRTKLVPLRVQGVNSVGSNKIDRVRFQWYSVLNEGNEKDLNKKFKLATDEELADNTAATVPPTIQLSFIKATNGTTINQYHQVNTGSDYATLVLLPSGEIKRNVISVPAENIYDQGILKEAGNVDIGTDKENVPKKVTCTSDTDFACSVELTGLEIETNDTAFLVVALPYGDTVTDFTVTLYSGDKVQEFVGAQISVDSTGRTNDLVRRVETRLDPADLFFPYPQYAAELNGEGGESIKKNFWITANCWVHQPKGGVSMECDQNGDL